MPFRPRYAKVKLTDELVEKTEARLWATNRWDTAVPGLGVRIQPSGHRAYKFVYSVAGKPVWIHIAEWPFPLDEARKIALNYRVALANRRDPRAELRSARGKTFAEVHAEYLKRAKVKNRSWKQADGAIRRHVLRTWGGRHIASITRADARELKRSISAPIAANKTLVAVSALFSWAIKEEIVSVNPVKGIEYNAIASRDRVLFDSEVKPFWEAAEGFSTTEKSKSSAAEGFPTVGNTSSPAAGNLEHNVLKTTSPVAAAALKVILLTGQRPGEISHMRIEHLRDGWWEMPGEEVPSLGWPGTKTKKSTRVFLVAEVRAIIDQIGGKNAIRSGFVFAGATGKPVRALDRAMRLVSKAAQLEPPVTPHDLRRSCATMAARLGYDDPAIDRLLNHSNRGVSKKHYNLYKYRKEDQAMMEKIAANVMGLARTAATS